MYKKVVLDNGLTIVMEEISFVRSISVGFWIRNGSRDERPGENGISHFIEHMLFKGTKSRSAKEIADAMDAIGGQMNAFTAKEYTCYYTRVLDEHFGRALDIMADMLFNSNFDGAEIEKERNVILEEINMYEDTPEDLVHDILQAAAFAGDELGYPILGTKKTINGFKSADFIEYKKRHYCPQNTVIALAGNFNADEMASKITEYFRDYNGEAYIPADYHAEYKSAIVKKEKKIEQLHLCLTFKGIHADSESSYALAVFNTLFGGGLSSRLFQSLREDRGLVYSIYSYSQSYSDAGLYTIYAALSPSQAEEAFKRMADEVAKVFTDKIPAEQIERTKDQLKSSYMLSLESTSSRMNSIGRSQLLLNRILTPDELIKKVDDVSYDDVYNVAEQILKLGSMSVSAVGRVKNIDFEGLAASVR